MSGELEIPEYGRENWLNLAGFYPAGGCLGPGRRAILWVQGCLMHCPGCVTPRMQPLIDRVWFDVAELAEILGSIRDIEGVTVVGGEPFLQARALAQLFALLRTRCRLTTMVYSGYTLDSLIASALASVQRLLGLTDILVDGPYRPELDFSQKWRGSENQIIHFLTPTYREWQWVLQARERDIEIHVDGSGGALILGIPPRGFYDKLQAAGVALV